MRAGAGQANRAAARANPPSTRWAPGRNPFLIAARAPPWESPACAAASSRSGATDAGTQTSSTTTAPPGSCRALTADTACAAMARMPPESCYLGRVVTSPQGERHGQGSDEIQQGKEEAEGREEQEAEAPAVRRRGAAGAELGPPRLQPLRQEDLTRRNGI